MLFHSSLRRELARSFGATLLVLLVIVSTLLLMRTLEQAHEGRVNPQEILLVLTYTVLARLPVVLSIALFVAVASTLTRMHRESEMVVWFSSGRSLFAFFPPVLRFAWPILAVIALLVLLVWPWANQQALDLRERFAQRGEVERLHAGRFIESRDGQSVFFLEHDPANPTFGHNIFVSSRGADGSQTVLSASSGRIERHGGQQWLLIQDGQRLLFDAPDAPGAVQVSEFASYRVLIDAPLPQPALNGSSDLRARPSWELIGLEDPASQAELAWRVGLALAAFNFVLVALALASSNPRATKSANLLLLLLAFVVYYNLMTLGRRWIGAGTVDALPFALALHGGVLLLSLLWLLKRQSGWTLNWRAWLAPRVQAPT